MLVKCEVEYYLCTRFIKTRRENLRKGPVRTTNKGNVSQLLASTIKNYASEYFIV